MAYSYIQYTGNGSQTSFTFPFGYLNQTDVTPSVGGIDLLVYDVSKYLGSKTTAPTLNNSGGALLSGALYYNSTSATMWIYNVSTWLPLGSSYVFAYLSANTLQITPAPVSGAAIVIHRSTPKVNPIVDFTDGSVLQSSDLDLLAQFSLYTAQESADQASSAVDAGTSAVSAAASATSATASATTATTQAGIATTQANTATNAATTSTTNATTATTQAGIATTQAGIATTGATTATTQAGIATTQAANALAISNNSSLAVIASDLGGMGFAYDLGSVTDTASGVSNSGAGHIVTVADNITSVNTAATNITAIQNASANATTATTQAGVATTQAGIATTQASNASTSATNTAALLASFRGVFLGAFTSDANAVTFAGANSITIVAGIMYENTTVNKFRIYSGSAWGDYDATAQTSQTAAALSATNAGTSASAASTSASNASSSASAASSLASTATTQASNASSSASAASSSASAASTSASNAATSETNAANSASSAAASVSSSLAKASNLADLANAATARTNLGVPSGTGSVSGTNTGDQTLPTLASLGGYAASNPSSYTTLAAVAGVGYATGGGSATGTNTGDQTLPVASSTAPAALGAAAVGVGTTFARSDHVHLQPSLATLGAQAAGTYVTAVTGTTPIVSSGGTTPALSLAASGVTAGSYTLSGITVDSFGRITAASNGSAGAGAGTVTSVAALTLGTTGTDVGSTVATGTSTPVITLNIPTASAANRGALSAADWSAFNGKQAALGFTPYNDTNPSSYTTLAAVAGVGYTTQAAITALPLSQLASTLDMGTVP